MKALILAGGEGTRLRPLTLNTPKPIVPVANIPFLRYQIELLSRHGIREVILSLSYQPHKIQAVLGDGSSCGAKIQYVVEKSPLGTAGAFKNAEAWLSEATLVFNGDVLCELDLGEVIRHHQSHKATATLVLTRVENPSAYGLVETGKDDQITRFLEKPGADEITCNTINAGTYVLEPEVLQWIPARENHSFERGLFPALLRQKRPMVAYVSEGYWIDIGTPQKYLQVHQDILHKRFRPSVELFSSERTGRGLGSPKIAASAQVDENTIMDWDVEIGEEARIISSSIGEHCVIGNHALVEGSVIWPGTIIGEHARLVGCVVGGKCQVGRHAVISRGVVLGDQSQITDYSLLPSEGSARGYV
jgi:NDP-sugar pyrophosphorylase family protein